MKQIFVGVGACAIDTILTVPQFPEQDSKLRALNCVKRRGGNVPNTLEVLQQLFALDNHARTPEVDLKLIATLPAASSPAIPFIKASFDLPAMVNGCEDTPTTAISSSKIDLRNCICREINTEPVSSYIISDASTGSRTIINHNELEEMTFDEFKIVIKSMLKDIASEHGPATRPLFHFHFEGRIPEVTLQCIQHLREVIKLGLTISVELEKPKREGLQELAKYADVIFYSKSWAEGEGYESGEQCISEQAKILQPLINQRSFLEQVLICTWGEKGSYGMVIGTDPTRLYHEPAFLELEGQVIDTVGAGDTFIAGVLFATMSRTVPSALNEAWIVPDFLRFGNKLAGHKIRQQGFAGLSKVIQPLIYENDAACTRKSAREKGELMAAQRAAIQGATV